MTAPAGFATVFAGWNVWDVSVADELETEVLMLGVSPGRRLRIFVEQTVQEAPGVDVAEPLNPLELQGEQVEIIDNPADLVAIETADQQKPGASLLISEPSHIETVRFFNKGVDSTVSWPMSFRAGGGGTRNFLLEAVYQPTAVSPLTKNLPSKSAADKVAEVFAAAGAIGGAILLWFIYDSFIKRR